MVLTLAELAGLASALLPPRTRLPAPERALADGGPAPGRRELLEARVRIERGEDPLGEAFCRLRPPERRREDGATYTPAELVAAMLERARGGRYARVVDAGAGSGRFLVAAGRAFPAARLVAVETDPLAALLCRAHLAAAGLLERAAIVADDYRAAALPGSGPTLFVGNPPYVRHHDISPRWKRWLAESAAALGLRASGLSGLHVHFLLRTVQHLGPGDRVVLVTAAEWLDTAYGALARALFAAHGGETLDVLEPTTAAFADAASTAVILSMRPGATGSVALRRVGSVAALGGRGGERLVDRAALRRAPRWSPLTRPARRTPGGLVELGELCRVHRGQVTGANAFWIVGAHGDGLPTAVLRPTVTHARELFAAGLVLDDDSELRRVVDLPEDLDLLPAAARPAVDAFLRRGRRSGVPGGYVAAHRRAWWAVRLPPPAPILATYMARRPPAFVVNRAGARHINIAHGLYPIVPLDGQAILALARHLCRSVDVGEGRVYAGGLAKFEPGEMQRLLVPRPEHLRGEEAAMSAGPLAPPVWTAAELLADRDRAVARFRDERVAEPLARYLAAFDAAQPVFADLVAWIAGGADEDGARRLLASEAHLEAFRYLASPPISADDLKILAEAGSLAPRLLVSDAGRLRAVLDVVLRGLDPRRFSWVGRRPPTPEEQAAAILASAALLAARRAETLRRTEGKQHQESAAQAALDDIGFRREEPRVIATLDAAPPPGAYCGESMLGGRKADLVVRLRDRRVLAIECKVSNSATNSIKRLNNDAAAKAVVWLREFGQRQLIPSALLAGVYNQHNLAAAQDAGLTLWWAHDLGKLQDFVRAAGELV